MKLNLPINLSESALSPPIFFICDKSRTNILMQKKVLIIKLKAHIYDLFKHTSKYVKTTGLKKNIKMLLIVISCIYRVPYN